MLVTSEFFGQSNEMVSVAKPILLAHLFVMNWWSVSDCNMDLIGHVLLYG